MQGWAQCPEAECSAQGLHLVSRCPHTFHLPKPTTSTHLHPLRAGLHQGITSAGPSEEEWWKRQAPLGSGEAGGAVLCWGHSTTPERSRAPQPGREELPSHASSAMSTGCRSPCSRATAAQRPEKASDCQAPTSSATEHSPPTPGIQANAWCRHTASPCPGTPGSAGSWVRGSSNPAFSSKHPKALN